MQVEKYEQPAIEAPKKNETILQKLKINLQRILHKSQTPQEIYDFLTHLSNLTRNEFFINKDMYREQENSRLFAENIEKMLIEDLKENKYYDEGGYQKDTHRFRFTSEVHGITPQAIQATQADWLHPINPEKFYSVNNLTIILHLPLYDLRRLLKAMRPIDINITTNHCMTEVDKGFMYYSLGDIIIKYRTNKFYENDEIDFDVITFIKETSFPDKDCFDGGHYRKLVGITKPYSAINTPQLIGGGQ